MTTQPPLRDALEEYLRLRRALGFKLNRAGRLLGQFVDYLEQRGVETISIDDALAWASLPAGASTHWRAIRLRAVRGFAAYLHGIDASVIVPPAGLIRSGPCRATPYLYSDCRDRLTVGGDHRIAATAAGRHLLQPHRPAGGQRHAHR